MKEVCEPIACIERFDGRFLIVRNPAGVAEFPKACVWRLEAGGQFRSQWRTLAVEEGEPAIWFDGVFPFDALITSVESVEFEISMLQKKLKALHLWSRSRAARDTATKEVARARESARHYGQYRMICRRIVEKFGYSSNDYPEVIKRFVDKGKQIVRGIRDGWGMLDSSDFNWWWDRHYEQYGKDGEEMEPVEASSSSIKVCTMTGYMLTRARLSSRIVKSKYLAQWLRALVKHGVRPQEFFLYEQRMNLVRLWGLSPEARELFQSNPGLFSLIANHVHFRDGKPLWSDAQMCATAKWKRNRILKEFGFPSGASIQDVLARLPGSGMNRVLPDYREIFCAQPKSATWVADYDDNRLLNAPKILGVFIRNNVTLHQRAIVPTLQIFRVAMREEPDFPVSEDSQEEYNEFEECQNTVRSFIEDTIHMINRLPDGEREPWLARLPRVRSKTKLIEVHNRVLNFINFDDVMGHLKHFIEEELDGIAPFPVPNPLASPDGWVPLVSPKLLKKESDEMAHCLFASYITGVAAQRYIAYSLHTPDGKRVTLGMVKEDTGAWRIDQMVCQANQPLTDQQSAWVRKQVRLMILRTHEKRRQKEREMQIAGQRNDEEFRLEMDPF